jgi:hypothetical protein
VGEFIGTLTAANRNAQHITQTRAMINRLLALAHVERLPDLKPSVIAMALERVMNSTRSVL